MGGSVNLDEGVQVGGSSFSCSFVDKCQGFDFDAERNWGQVE